ncbi:MAG TPA: FkbM family methyltransferase [Bryobacteraceae bacterium]|nr:FkbM family methyltransferase [Bryobacteraceae bacterium]
MAQQLRSPYPISAVPESPPSGGGGIAVFDSPDALAINTARMAHLDSLGLPLAGKSVLDVGCGVGRLARFFVERDCRVTCVDGRTENIAALRARYPDMDAQVANVETDSLLPFGQFDIVFCYGLLYHLENPVAGLRNMAQVTRELLLLETVVTDYSEAVLRLEDEPVETLNQALGGLGSRPSPAFVAMTLSRAGFSYVYAPKSPPDHADFEFEWLNDLASSRHGHLLRSIFVASRWPLASDTLALLLGDSRNGEPEVLRRERAGGPSTLHRVPREMPVVPASRHREGFGSHPAWLNHMDALEAAKDLIFVRPLVPYPGWSFGADWDNPDLAFRQRRRIWEYFNKHRLAVPFVFSWYGGLQLNLYLGNDLSRQLFIAGCAEPNEFAFLDQILAPGMIFVDVGANEGLYTLFASQRVGTQGKVWAFEPSEREFGRLQQNLSLNQLDNVQAFHVALADTDSEQDLTIAGYEHEGHNTLGAFANQGVSLLRTERVTVRTLDCLVREARLPKIDVIKMDVEGAEQRVIQGARAVLAEHRPVVIFEASGPALEKQRSSLDALTALLTSFQYRLFAFDSGSGRPIPAFPGSFSDNMIAIPAESSLATRLAKEADAEFAPEPAKQTISSKEEESPLPTFSPARAYWNQRTTLAGARDRILSLGQAVDQRSDLWPYQWAQLMAAAIDFAPDLILELGRGKGNSTCAFTEASNINEGRSRILSLCLSDSWERETLPRLRKIVPAAWFHPLQAQRADILEFDYRKSLSGAKRVLIFWDAHGFDIAECVLGEILPIVAPLEHLIIMHDLSDTRYSSDEQFEYGGHGLWKGNNWSGPRLKIGIIDSAVEQSIAALDFTTRNHLTLDSADHSFHSNLTSDQQTEMRRILGDLFETQAHWFYFSLNERPGPYRFPHFTRPQAQARGSKARS